MKNWKSLIIVLLCVVFFTTAAIIIILSPGPPDFDAGEPPEHQGTGTFQDPFLIDSATRLREVLDAHAGVQNRAFRLTSNIDLTGTNWIPVPVFAMGSVFDGAGHTITGLTVTSGGTAVHDQVSNMVSRGMFSNFQGTIRNVTFQNASIQGGSNAGVIAGWIGPVGTNLSASVGTMAVLIENVRIQGGNVGNEVLPTWRTGAFIGGTRGMGTSNADRFSITIRNSSNEMALVRGGNSSGGFIGHVGSQNLNLTISNSFQHGNVQNTSNIVGGIIGTVGMNTNANVHVLIENSFAMGSFRAEGTYGGGIVGWVGHNPITLTIENSFAMANVSSAFGPNGGVFGGAASGMGPNIRLNNSFFSSTTSPNMQVAGANVSAANMATSAPRTTAQMMTQEFVNQLNAGSNPPNFVLGPNGPVLRIFTDRVSLTFDANNGRFPSGATTFELPDLEQGSTLASNAVVNPARFGYTFAGWATMQTGGELFTNLNQIPTNINRTFFARWNAIQYRVRTHAPSLFAGQQILFYNDVDPFPVTSFTIHQRGHIQTHLPSTGPHFVGWEVLQRGENPALAASWTNIGTGFAVTGEQAHPAERRLSLFNAETGDYLIDEEFITDFATLTGGNYYIYFRAIFQNIAPHVLSLEAYTTAQMGWGTVRIDGFTRAFGEDIQFAHNHNSNVLIEITPNRFRGLGALEFSTNNGTSWINIIPVSTIDGVVRAEIAPQNLANMRLRVRFTSETFNMRVIANISAANAGVSSTTSVPVSLGSNFGNVWLSPVGDYRLISNSFDNVRIFDHLEEDYVYFSAINGHVSFPAIDEDFLERFVDFEGGFDMITVYAVFVRQFEISVEVNDSSLGSLFFTVIQPNGVTYHPSALSGDTYIEGTTIVINILPIGVSRIMEVDGLDAGERDGEVITIVLARNRNNIVVNFAVAHFTIVTWAVDSDGHDIESEDIITAVSNPGPHPETTRITSITVTYDEEAFGFMGWFAMVGEEFRSLEEFVDPIDNSIRDLDLTASFIYRFADGNQFRFVAMLGVVHAVVFDVAGFEIEGRGTFSAIVVVFDEEEEEWAEQGQPIITVGTQEFVQGTMLRITTEAAQFFSLHSIDGLLPEEEIIDGAVIIVVNGFRTISIVFLAERIDIEPVFNIDRGSAQISSTNIAIGDIITITFTPDSGYQLNTFRINNTLASSIGRVSGNVVMITIDEDLLNEFQGEFTIQITTIMNQLFMWGVLAGGVLIPLMVLAFTLIALSNANKKRQYARMLERRKEGAIMMGQVDQMKQLRGEQQ